MKMPNFSSIAHGRIFEHGDIMGMGEGADIIDDEEWAINKEQSIMMKLDGSKVKEKELGMKMKLDLGAQNMKMGEMDIINKLKPHSFNISNDKIFGGNKMETASYSKKVDDIMGKSKGKSNGFNGTVEMIIGKSSKSKNITLQDKTNMLSMTGGGKSSSKTFNTNEKLKMFGIGDGMNVANKLKMFGLGKGVKVQSKNVKAKNNMPTDIMGISGGVNTKQKLSKLLGTQYNQKINIKQPKGKYKVNTNMEAISRNRINMQNKVGLFTDTDKDNVMDVFDCNPLNHMEQGKIHDFFAKVGAGTVTGIKGAATSVKERFVKTPEQIRAAAAEKGIRSLGTELPVEKIQVYGKEPKLGIAEGTVLKVQTAATGFKGWIDKQTEHRTAVKEEKIQEVREELEPAIGKQAYEILEPEKRLRLEKKKEKIEREEKLREAKLPTTLELETSKSQAEIGKIRAESKAEILKAMATKEGSKHIVGYNKKGKPIYAREQYVKGAGGTAVHGIDKSLGYAKWGVGGTLGGIQDAPIFTGGGQAMLERPSGSGLHQMSSLPGQTGSGFLQMLGVPVEQQVQEQQVDEMQQPDVQQMQVQPQVQQSPQDMAPPPGWVTGASGKPVRYRRPPYRKRG